MTWPTLFTWLDLTRRRWRAATVADVGEWVGWLRMATAARQGHVDVFACRRVEVERTDRCSASLAAVSAFYGFHRRLDPAVDRH